MWSYIARRLLLMIPTLFGIMLLNFIIVQAAPGGPVEQVLAQLDGMDSQSSTRIGSGEQTELQSQSSGSDYRGAQGIDPMLIKEIEQQINATVWLRQARS